MPKIPVIKSRVLVHMLLKLGFVKFHQVGSHAQFKNNHGVRVTVAVHAGKDLNKKTLKGILNDLNMPVEDFIRNLKDL